MNWRKLHALRVLSAADPNNRSCPQIPIDWNNGGPPRIAVPFRTAPSSRMI